MKTFLKMVCKVKLPEDVLQRKPLCRWFTKNTFVKMVCKETSMKMVYKGNLPEDGLQRKHF
jgi:hypothetical protein